ncbi:MAG: winged helix-turn-helix domain-containing protein [Candidatus Bathyarchaeales archaeon]
MGSYRSSLDIIADILNVVGEGGTKKTQIMYRANLSYRLLEKYLKDVLEAFLLRFDDGCQRYVLTSKGRRFLEVYKEYSRRNKHVEKVINDLHEKRRRLKELCSRGDMRVKP